MYRQENCCKDYCRDRVQAEGKRQKIEDRKDIAIAPAILLHNICFGYHNSSFLFYNLNLTLPAGKCVCLLGQSGVGKSTLLRLIAGLITKNTSISSPLNITASDNKPIAHRIAYMAQQDLLMPWLSVLDNVLLGSLLRNTYKKSKLKLKMQAKYILQQVGLADAIYQKPATLSGGMRQRVALARTLMEDKPIVLMDEPFSALDAITRFKLQNLAVKLLMGKTVLLVTHDPLEALRLADVIHVLSGLPAEINFSVTLQSKFPRDLSDSKILNLHAKLLAKLSGNLMEK